jgi:hypothetical protein
MIPSTAIGLVIAALAVLPGAVYVWSHESQTGSFGVALSDRLLRFLGVSAVIQVIAGWPEYGLYRAVRTDWPNVSAGTFATAWGLFVALVALPALAGTVVGRCRKAGLLRGRLLQIVFSDEVAPRAWDDSFMGEQGIYLRVRTTDDCWILGRYAKESYVGGFPAEKDLRLEETYQVLPDGKRPGKALGYATYIPESSIKWIEFLPQRK